MRIAVPEPIEQVVANLLRLANTKLPMDVGWALEAAAGWERNPVATTQLGCIMDNVKKAEFMGRPMCQDTGTPVFFVSGRFDHTIAESIRKGVAIATSSIPLRPNAVDPLTRENTGDNVGVGFPSIHYEPSDGDLRIDLLVKGAGSENMTRLAMLNPSGGRKAVEDFVYGAVVSARGNPCPPTVVGVGIGGTADDCVRMSKEALAVPLDADNPDGELAGMEESLFVRLNSSGLGPMGLGGDTTVLGVRIKKAHCHTASLPVAVSLGCWATRRASATIDGDGVATYGQGGSF
ncbi:MAG: fumarate hydratase [Thermoplasmatales archaeon]|nr:fumarate hydratase [Thermoplasmatales archaeon]